MIKESEIPQLWAWKGKEMIDSSFAIAAEEVLGLVRDCDWDNMHMRTRHVVESDPHFSKPLPEPIGTSNLGGNNENNSLYQSVPELIR